MSLSPPLSPPLSLSSVSLLCLRLLVPQAFSGLSGSSSQLRVIFSFYASTIVSALEAMDKVSESVVSKLLPYVQRVSTFPCVLMSLSGLQLKTAV